MKKIIAAIAVLFLLATFGCAHAFNAFNWTSTQNQKCEEYAIHIEKYVRYRGDMGVAYSRSQSATAKVGDIVYFNVLAVNGKGGYVTPELSFHDLAEVSFSNGMYTAKVIGNEPSVKATILNKTDINNLWHNNTNIGVYGDTVVIGSLTFTRNGDGLVLDVYCSGSAGDMYRELNGLNITVDDIYSGRVNMSDDVLISNFGRICRAEASASWYEIPTVVYNTNLEIPKTGSRECLASVVIILCSAACLWAINKKEM